eukprot:TRINITY_DN54907_c0_g1_i1.p1 TRINITY_DN54907_c0_g1~~TRINITY_DN54907_c0_g1_i1.p1  ORF type:complete len:527 (+),score=79.48 TRINITY_DN54907_c0_g1_i1:34-1614(+)
MSWRNSDSTWGASASWNSWSEDDWHKSKDEWSSWTKSNSESNAWLGASESLAAEESEFGSKLDRHIEWKSISLKAITKDFYFEHPDITKLTDYQVELVRKENGIEIVGDVTRVPKPIQSFETAGFPPLIMDSVRAAKRLVSPTPIQRQVWPVALQGHDLIGIAETGSGKTLAYVLPMLVHILAQPTLNAGEGPVGVILSPTRELAQQIASVAEDFAGSSGIRTCCVFGGGSIKSQGEALQQKNDIVVATPGRFIQLLNDRWTNLNRVTFLVLDEADEMLSRGFEPQIDLVLSQVRPDRQILMFSATWPQEVQKLAEKHCTTEPIFVRIGSDALAACRIISQVVRVVKQGEKFDRLVESIKKCKCDQKAAENKCLVFCKTKLNVDEVGYELQNKANIACVVLHGGMDQRQRTESLNNFKDRFGESVLVCTGILGRGHDIPCVRYVINYDYPGKIEDYIHRIGRTGRAGERGFALTFLTDEEQDAAADLVKVLRHNNQAVEDDLAQLARGGAETEWDSSWGNAEKDGG